MTPERLKTYHDQLFVANRTAYNLWSETDDGTLKYPAWIAMDVIWKMRCAVWQALVKAQPELADKRFPQLHDEDYEPDARLHSLEKWPNEDECCQ